MAKWYIVERLSWGVSYEDPVCYPEEEDAHGVPVAIFAKKAAATKRRKELAAAARRETNPFQFEGGELELLSSAQEASVVDRVIELGLVPPPPGEYSRDWVTWYDGLASQLTDAQRDGVWDLLDKLTLYAVVPVELEE